MNKYDNLIYLALTEVGVDLYKSTNFVTYPQYCNGLYTSLLDNKLSLRDLRHINQYSSAIEKLFTIDYGLTGVYIVNYLGLDTETLHRFSESVIQTKSLFKDTGEAINR